MGAQAPRRVLCTLLASLRLRFAGPSAFAKATADRQWAIKKIFY